MASQIATQASSHPGSRIFREHPSFPLDFEIRRRMESAMGQYRARPFERAASRSPPRPVRDYRGLDTTHVDSCARQQPNTKPSPGRSSLIYTQHEVPSQHTASTTRPYNASTDGNRMSVGHLVDGPRSSPSQSAMAYSPETRPVQNTQGLSTRMSPPRMTEQEPRLPGIGSLLSMATESQPNERDPRYPPLAVSTSFQPQQYHHSAKSSLSSAVSEPISPSSYGGGYHSRSPVQPPQSSMDSRARTNSHLPYYARDEQQLSSHYDHPRAHTLPMIPRHGTGFHDGAQNGRMSYPSLRDPIHGQSMLPPPSQESYTPFSQYSSQRAVYPYPPSHHPSQAQEPGWDRPRMDGAMPPGFDAQTASVPPYGWPYMHHTHASMARKRRGNLPKEATKLLKDWFGRHHDSPYPSEDEKQELCRRTNLQISQVNNWFINARRRLPRDDARKQVEMEGQQRSTTVDSTDSVSEPSAPLSR